MAATITLRQTASSSTCLAWKVAPAATSYSPAQPLSLGLSVSINRVRKLLIPTDCVFPGRTSMVFWSWGEAVLWEGLGCCLRGGLSAFCSIVRNKWLHMSLLLPLAAWEAWVKTQICILQQNCAGLCPHVVGTLGAPWGMPWRVEAAPAPRWAQDQGDGV